MSKFLKKVLVISLVFLMSFSAFAGVFDLKNDGFSSEVLISANKPKKGGKAKKGADDGSDKITVKLLTDKAGIDDKSFNASAWRGIERFYHNPNLNGKSYSFEASDKSSDFLPNLKSVSTGDTDLIVTTGFYWANPINIVAKDNPNQKYLIVDAESDKLPNVTCALFEEETGSYLVGIIAARQAELEGIKNPKFAFIGGIPNSTLTRFEVGFVQGVRSVLPNAEIVDYYANSFSSPEVGKSQAKQFYDSGAYCIFAATGATGVGVIEQAKEYRQQGKNVWVVGVDSDQYEDGIYNTEDGSSAVLTSMLKNIENATYQVLTEIQNGKFSAGVKIFGLSDECVGFSTSNPLLSSKIVKYAEDAKRDIIKGTIKVEKTYKNALKKGLVPQLKAVDG